MIGNTVSSKERNTLVMKVQVKAANKVFTEAYTLSRRIFDETAQELRAAQGTPLTNTDDFSLQEKFTKRAGPAVKELRDKAITEELAKVPELSEMPRDAFDKLSAAQADQVEELDAMRENLNNVQYRFLSVTLAFKGLSACSLCQIYQFIGRTDDSEGLEHIECLQTVFNYEKQTLKAYVSLLGALIEKGVSELAERKKRLEALAGDRYAVKELVEFAASKIGESATPELAYDPLLLFLRQSFKPSRDAGYFDDSVTRLYHRLVIEPQVEVRNAILSPDFDQTDLAALVGLFKGRVGESVGEEILGKVGVEYDL